MNKILNIMPDCKLFMIIFFALMLGLLSSITITAQPDWRDSTACYFYTIIDENGKEVSFKKNNQYSIMIDDILYVSPDIPQHKLTNDSVEGYQNQIRINDFSLTIPQKNNAGNKQQLKIKIIHNKDTMHFCQITSVGTRNNEWVEVNLMKRGRTKKRIAGSLQFIKGYYYFPKWRIRLMINIPETTGNVKIMNVNQRNFLIPQKIYDSLIFSRHNLYNRKADELVLNNFTRGHFSVEKKIEPPKFDKSLLPYKNSSWIDKFMFPSKDSNRYYGLIYHSISIPSLPGGGRRVGIFSVLNKKENTIQQWFPKDDSRLFMSNFLYRKPMSDTLYLSTWMTNEFYDCQDKERYKAKKYIHRSEDEGRTWEEDKTMTDLFNKYNLIHFRLLDNGYALGGNKNIVKGVYLGTNTYYLLKNMQVIDSLKIPDDVSCRDISRLDLYPIKNNTLFLYCNDKNSTEIERSYDIAFLIKVDDKWKFQTGEKKYVDLSLRQPEYKQTTEGYQNFYLINKSKLVFDNGSGTLQVNRDNYSILENGKHIYLIGRGHSNGFTNIPYISFDGGTSWYVYPLRLEEMNYNDNYHHYYNYGHSYDFLDINEQNEISYFSNPKPYRVPRKIVKISHKFLPE